MPKVPKLRKYKLTSQADPYSVPTKGESDRSLSLSQSSETATSSLSLSLSTSESHTSAPVLSRGQKRRQEKRERVLTKLGVLPLKGMKTAPTNTSNIKIKQKKQTMNFDSLLSELEATLPTTSAENAEVVRPAALTLKSNKIKKSVAIRETQRMKLVEQHPSFLSDPLQAMKAHIEHMIALKTKSKINS